MDEFTKLQKDLTLIDEPIDFDSFDYAELDPFAVFDKEDKMVEILTEMTRKYFPEKAKR